MEDRAALIGPSLLTTLSQNAMTNARMRIVLLSTFSFQVLEKMNAMCGMNQFINFQMMMLI